MAKNNIGCTMSVGGLPTLLTVLFVALKLLGKINWSWWWVTAPTWIPAGLAVIILILFGIITWVVATYGD